MHEENKVIPVRVALRCRPLLSKEISEGCQTCIKFIPKEPQVILGDNRCFTYDCVFQPDSSQQSVYEISVSKQIDQLFKGYNVTVLAYGQTGSGKTYTMGTSHTSDLESDEKNMGIIPRAVKDIMKGISESSGIEYTMKVSFLEIYKEDLYDLLSDTREKDAITVRENFDGIKIMGLTELKVHSAEETLKLLERGSLTRTTASTAMNFHSSRSHAVFTISIEQCKGETGDSIHAKFQFVDLAGSERAKKTGAQGERFKEGVNINRGLLALGNVISALCDESPHIPYRDSKLTRLLQDSLGGNSHTVMIACVSPADSNMEETLNTLRYAYRARKIKNKPIVNRDLHDAEVAQLKKLVKELQAQLLQNRPVNGGSPGLLTDPEDYQILLKHNKKLEEENRCLARELQNALDQTTSLCERAVLAEMAKESLLQQLEQLKEKSSNIVNALSELFEGKPEFQEKLQLVKELQEKIVGAQIEHASQSELTMYSPAAVKDKGADADNSEAADNSENAYPTEDDKEFQLQVTLRQAAMNRELQELERALALKEDLANRMKETDTQMAVVRMQYENSMRQLEEEIAKLQKEKEELMCQLKAAHTTSAVNKVSERRRKRLQELEAHISQLKKEMSEKARMLKIKDEAERKVKVLQQEIQNMKQARVRLLRQMKAEAERHRQWKMEKDRELARLKQQERKRQVELVKMERMYSKQQTVLKRKMEEAMAANKRLQNAMQKQKAISESRERQKDQSMQGVSNRIWQWLLQELDVVVSSKEVEHHLKNLLEDRKAMTARLNHLKNKIDDAEPPEKISPGKSPESNRQMEMEQLQQELELRNIQIADLQQRIIDVDQDEKAKYRWESIHSMVEAKCALKSLFEYAVSIKSEMFQLDRKCRENQNNIQDSAKHIQQLQHEIDELKSNHHKELSAQAREHEDKTLYMLKQMQQSSNVTLSASSDIDASVIERLKFQENEITRLHYLHEELQKKSEEVESLKNQLVVARYKGTRTSLLPDIGNNHNAKKPKTRVLVPETPSIVSNSEGDESEASEDSSDPDWVKTPFTRRRPRNQIKRGDPKIIMENISAEDDSSDKMASKKQYCRCSGYCKNKQCGCRRENTLCTESCKCSEDICRNRNKENSSSSIQDSSGDTLLNTTFNVNESKIAAKGGTFDNRGILTNKNENIHSNKQVQNNTNLLSGAMKRSDDTYLNEKGDVKKRRHKIYRESFFGEL